MGSSASSTSPLKSVSLSKCGLMSLSLNPSTSNVSSMSRFPFKSPVPTLSKSNSPLSNNSGSNSPLSNNSGSNNPLSNNPSRSQLPPLSTVMLPPSPPPPPTTTLAPFLMVSTLVSTTVSA